MPQYAPLFWFTLHRFCGTNVVWCSSMALESKKTVRLSVTLLEGQYARVNEIAQQTDVSTAWIIRKAVAQFLEQYEQPVLPFLGSAQSHKSA